LTQNSKPGNHATRQVKGRAKRNGVPLVAWLGLAGLLLVAAGLFLTRQSFAGSTAATGSVPVQVSGKPKLAADRDTIDLGRLPLDKTVKATFKLSNVGDKPLGLNGTPQVQAVKGC
jgi:hypothetical protein